MIYARRILSVIVTVVLLAGMTGPFLGTAYAAEGDNGNPYSVSVESIVNSSGVTPTMSTFGNKNVTIVVTFLQKNAELLKNINATETVSRNNVTVSAGLSSTESMKALLSVEGQTEDGAASMRLTLQNVDYNGGSYSIYVRLENLTKFGDYKEVSVSTKIPDSYFTRSPSGNSGSDDIDDDIPKADILVENVIVTDSTGERVDRVTKDSPPFNVGIIFADYGLRAIDSDDLADEILEVFLTNAGSFVPSRGNRGEIKMMASSSSDAPRFRVDFKNVTWDGGSNNIEFQVRYNFWGDEVIGSKSVTVYQARAKAEDEEEEKTVDPPTPYITVDQYSYGDSQIEAGTTFDLNLTFRNTSAVLPLENILITFSPDPDADLTIASASNSYYVENLAAGANISYAIQLQAKPDASVKSHNVQIAFKYEYVVKDKREIKDNNGNLTIAIPVSQIDRFAVDPITEVTPGIVGEAAYIPVSFINRGKAATFNISGFAKGNLEIIAPAEHYGNLDAGKSDSIDVTLVPQQPGELFGEIIIQYEDENTNQKEIAVPFTMYVEAPYVPEPPPENPEPGMGEMLPEPEKTINIGFCVTGGILMAVPIALYLMKRVKAKGSEDFDEGF